MKLLGGPRTTLSVLSLAAVAWVAFGDLGRKAPGELTAVHARVPELQGFGSCSQCHGGWSSSMTDSCLECHAVIEEQLQSARGLHGSLEVGLARTCQTCHSEHHGTDFAIVNRASFAVAGIPEPTAFDHRLIGYELVGAHVERVCADCHPHADALVLPAGERRFIGLSRDCASCHDDPHGGRYVIDCTSCHGQHAFEQLEPADHARHLPLLGVHAELDCLSCHAEGGDHGFERLGTATGGAPRACADCHDSPHRESFAARSSCADCHAVDHAGFTAAAAGLERAAHAASGFALTAPHDAVGCAGCHGAPGEAGFAERHPGRLADDCAACHADPHGGQFDLTHAYQGGSGGARCLDCHATASFAPHRFTAERHAETRLPLEGRHADADCARCHVEPGEAGVRRFAGTDPRCASCHGDAHDGYFAAYVETADDCSLCHDLRGFATERTRTSFDHDRLTAFAVDGAHAQAACESCHLPAAERDATGRQFGRIADAHGSFAGCTTCHADPHLGAFDRVDLPAEIDGRRDCARCHGDVTFRVLRDDWEHGLWTGYALRGAHRSTDCGACHAPRFEPDAQGRTWAAAAGTRCADCHVDPHAGQFATRSTDRRSERGVDCARCHSDEQGFDEPIFDHDVDSRFPLDAQHAKVPCAQCHRLATIGGRDDVVRYRGTPRDCADCHGDQRNPLRGGRGTR